MYSTHNEGKSVVAERFIRTLKSKIYKYMTSISKNVYIDKLDDIVDEYNNTYHTTIKMKPIDVKDNTYINASKEINNKDPKFKVGNHVKISKYKNIFAKGYMPNWSEEVFVIKKVKNTIPWTYVINDLNGEEIIGTFYEKELQKTNQEEFRIEKVIRRKGNKLYVKWKGYDNSFNSWIDKGNFSKNVKRYYKMSYYPPYGSSSNNIKVKLDLCNYTTKDDVKNITHVDVSSYATKTNLAALKTEVDKIDIDKLETVPDDLAKLTNVVKNEVVKKITYNTLKNKVDAIDTSKFVSRTKFTADTNSLDDKIDKVEKKIPFISGLATKSSVTRLITEQEDYTDKVKKKIPDISGLVSKTELTVAENKIPDISCLATTSTLTAVENKIPDITNLITKTDLDTKLKSVSDRVTNNKSKDILLGNELKKLKTRVDSSEKIKLNDLQREISFNRGFFYYLQQSYLVYECKVNSFAFNGKK